MKLVLFRFSLILLILAGFLAVKGGEDSAEARGRRRLPRRGGCSTCAVQENSCPASCPCGCSETGVCDCGT